MLQGCTLAPGPRTGLMAPGPHTGLMATGPHTGLMAPGPHTGLMAPGPHTGWQTWALNGDQRLKYGVGRWSSYRRKIQF